ncbi:MAG: carboxymuconolactone decarboxylase family protein [Dissulfurimicrobium sp.]|uniref:carboxymuconolactone decarboxylase family protein n=1 Tax=Dissulfurimicrobium TaxID=1769732 RepID=UPI003C710955
MDRKTKEIIAMVVSVMKGCQYCHLAHQTMALCPGATEKEICEAMMAVKLFQSFMSIADSLEVPCDVTTDMAAKQQPA